MYFNIIMQYENFPTEKNQYNTRKVHILNIQKTTTTDVRLKKKITYV